MGIMGKFMGKSDKQIIKEQVRKEKDKQEKFSMKIAEQCAMLGSCKDAFERIITIDRLNVLERRDKRIGDAAQKSRIHDAAVGLLAVEELELEIKSAGSAYDFAKAQKKITSVIRQIHRLDPDAAISKKEYQGKMKDEFDNTNETESFADRADLVDEQFVEALIQGDSMEECLRSKLSRKPVRTDSTPIDFGSGNEKMDASYVKDILRKNADKR